MNPAHPSSAIALSSITKTFGSTRALNAASLTARPNTIHALLGENGAGKTTLMRIAFGMITPDAGTITIDNIPHTFHSSADAISAGIGMVHQHFTLVPTMSIAENIALGQRQKPFRYTPTQARHLVTTLTQRTNLPANPDSIVNTLPVAAQQRVEILKALASNATSLILDEPTAVLAPDQARDLLKTLRTFANTAGTVILITHKLRDALEFSDDITVLRHGETVFSAPTPNVTALQLTNAMLGAPILSQTPITPSDRHTFHPVRDRATRTPNPLASPPAAIFSPQNSPTLTSNPTTPPEPQISYRRAKHLPPIFRLRNVNIVNTLGVTTIQNATLTVYPGEIVGIAAIEGSGQHELLRVLAGRLKASTGLVEIPDTIGFIPEDRHRDALILDFPLYENIALFNAHTHTGTIPWTNIQKKTAALMTAYDVRADTPQTRAKTLSGGNQQKLIIAREIDGAPHALVAENPTRGLDIQATNTIHHRLKSAKDHGTAIIVYSSDLDEILTLADRIIVIHAGTLHEVPHDRDIIGHTMLSGTMHDTTQS